jgi:xylulokinase
MGVMLAAAGSLRWFRDRFAPDAPFDDLVAEADGWAAGADGLFFLPYLAGERTPHADPNARGAFVGLSMHHDRGALVRAVLEGVAFGLRDSLELLRGLGVEASHARVSGGGSRGDVWLRIVATVLGMPLETTAADEGSAFGAALLGGVAGGMFADVHEAAGRCVRVERHIDPDAAEADAYDQLYQRFRALYPALHDDKEERP